MLFRGGILFIEFLMGVVGHSIVVFEVHDLRLFLSNIYGNTDTNVPISVKLCTC